MTQYPKWRGGAASPPPLARSRLPIRTLYATHVSCAPGAFGTPDLAIKDVLVVMHEADELDIFFARGGTPDRDCCCVRRCRYGLILVPQLSVAVGAAHGM